tara:strand:+ start:11 stop:910 length:900 start_codon:yes stop_codon:yes gene_type:complete
MKGTSFELSCHQIRDVTHLAQICQAEDGYLLPIYPHILATPRPNPSTYLHYQNQELVGFIGLYFFYQNAVELSILVHPSHRKKRLATQMFQKMIPILSALQLDEIILSGFPKSMNDWLLKRKYNYFQSEYEMIRRSKHKINVKKPSLLIKKASMNDLSQLNMIDKACFEAHDADIRRLTHLLEDRHYRIFVGLYNETIIAKAHLRGFDDVAKLSDIAVLPDYQKKGYGSEMIAHCVNYALDTHNLSSALDVETKNKTAIKLYTKMDFEITNHIDFFKVSLQHLKDCYKTYNLNDKSKKI